MKKKKSNESGVDIFLGISDPILIGGLAGYGLLKLGYKPLFAFFATSAMGMILGLAFLSFFLDLELIKKKEVEK